MDTLTHALSGALVSRTLPESRVAVRRRAAACFLACASPDLDFVFSFLGPVQYLELHRGPTHSLLMLPLWALVVSWLLSKLLREPGGWRALYGVTALGVALHIAGDLITSFGTLILWPLSDWRAGIGTTFIIDLWFSGIILAGLAASLAFRGSRIPSVVATLALVGYVGFQAVLKSRAVEFGERHAQSLGLAGATVRAEPRPVSPFNWTVYVSTPTEHHYAHVNLVRQAPVQLPPDAGFVARLDAPYRPLGVAAWATRPRFGETDAEVAIAREAWNAPALGFFRWFAEIPTFDGISEGSTCVWFRDLRFAAPGREEIPFRYGVCRSVAGDPWRPHLWDGESGPRRLD